MGERQSNIYTESLNHNFGVGVIDFYAGKLTLSFYWNIKQWTLEIDNVVASFPSEKLDLLFHVLWWNYNR